MKIAKTIELLRKIILDPNCARMNKSTVKGFLGELIVRNELEDAGFQVEQQGNQAGHDLEMNNGAIKIDVKTSLLKDEFSWGVPYWGWALISESKKRKISATHFVCLGCDKQLNAHTFIIIPAKKVNRSPQGMPRFSKVKHGLIVFPSSRRPKLDKLSKEKTFIDGCEKFMSNQDIGIIKSGKSLKKYAWEIK